MSKGLFTQAVAMLLARSPQCEDVTGALAGTYEAQFLPPDAGGGVAWMMGVGRWRVRIPGTQRGVAELVLAPTPWPDGMGDPKADPELFGAWSMGFLGPHTYPGAVGRAVQFATAAHNGAAAELAGRHSAVLLIRCTHAPGAGENEPLFPPDFDAVRELKFLDALVGSLFGTFTDAVYFNPGGETLFRASDFEQIQADAASAGLLPLRAWCNARIFKLEEEAPGWTMMDSIGCEQLDEPGRSPRDHEACWAQQQTPLDTRDVWAFLLSMGAYAAEHGPVIKNGDTTEGAGIRWRGLLCEHGLAPPPRLTVRWFPDGASVPAALRVGAEPSASAGSVPGVTGGFMSRLRRKLGLKT